MPAPSLPSDGLDLPRCDWAVGPLLAAYHDDEWGVPLHGDRALFELLTLEGAQAGLSWRSVLARRDGYRRAFAGFDPPRVAALGPAEQARILADASIIRNRAKVAATVGNARALLELQAAEGSFDSWLWDRVGGRPVVNHWRSAAELPATSALSEELSRDLRRRGFRFVGPTICYAFLQAAGLVMDHLVSCHRYPALS